jgi:trans-2-enoyl-CoA reductase
MTASLQIVQRRTLDERRQRIQSPLVTEHTHSIAVVGDLGDAQPDLADTDDAQHLSVQLAGLAGQCAAAVPAGLPQQPVHAHRAPAQQ